MMLEIDRIRRVLRDVRRRWMWHTIFGCGTRAAGSASLVALAAWVAFRLIAPRTGAALVAFGGITIAAAVVAILQGLWPLTRRPSDAQVARFIEERCPQLEDRLVTAVEWASPAIASRPSLLSDLLYRDAAARVAELDLDRTISRRALARAGAFAVASALALGAAGVLVAPAVRAGGAALLGVLGPARFGLHVSPGNAKVVAGSELRIEVRLDFTLDGAAPAVLLRDANGVTRSWKTAPHGPGRFDYVIRPSADFRYSVTAGRAQSSEYRVTVLRPPAVTAIDVHYQYPAFLRMPPHTEMDGGDVFGPAGTRVHLVVHSDRPARSGSLVMAGGAPLALSAEGDRRMGADFTVTADGSYRVVLKDADGLESGSDTEYFIRMLADTPPDVRVVAPGADREVTPLEEVPIAAHADDDRGVKQFDLVYSVRGGPETVVPFVPSGTGQSMDGKRVLYLEDLHVRPGDFVTYYARARDSADASRRSEARSDMFFLQVTPFEQEFMPPQSSQVPSHGMTAAQSHSLDDLIKAQKEIVVATWRLDRRSRKSGSGSESDVKTVARAQGDLRNRAAEMAGPALVRAATAGQTPDPGHRTPDAALRTSDSDPMASALEAMGRAEQSLNAINTAGALPHETRALSELLKAKADNQRWQMMQASRAGAGGNTGNADLTTMFEDELRREQRTNYEIPHGSQGADDQRSEALERVRQLAERQGDLSRRQQELARNRDAMSPDEVRRQLERLTREQSELRQQAEELAQRMDTGGGQQAEGGKRRQSRQQAEQAGSGTTGAQGASQLRDASNAMGQATASLRSGQLNEASARSGQAADRLRSAERQMQEGAGAQALGDLQMQARQIADAQERIARDTAAAATAKPGDGGDAGKRDPAKPSDVGAARARDAEMRRLAGEKERLADQVEQLAKGLKGAGSNPWLEGRQRQAIDTVSRDMDRLQLPKQMREGAAAMRSPEKADVNRPPAAEGEQDLARTLGRLADRLGAAAAGGETQRTAEQLGEAKDARNRLAQLEQKIRELQRQGSNGTTGAQGGAASNKQSNGSEAVGTSGRDTTGDHALELKRLQDEYERELRRAADQLNRFGRDGGGAGFTPKDARALSPLSAPGFHQDFSKWEQLSQEINAGLERAETALTGRLRAQKTRDRLQAPSADHVPEQYRRLVEQYYQSLAGKKK